jgi:DNA topoisomerase VI subunit B
MKMSSATLERTTFETSRQLEFFSEKELAMQIGQPRPLWALALLKELVDNALDACENAGVQPQVRVVVRGDSFTVQDNGPGLPAAVLERSLDYAVRVSDKAYYVSPTRGQLGNALKCVWAAPFVVSGEYGKAQVLTPQAAHTVEVSLDRIGQEPRLKHTAATARLVKTGTLFKVHWPDVAKLARQPRVGSFLQRPLSPGRLRRL